MLIGKSETEEKRCINTQEQERIERQNALRAQTFYQDICNKCEVVIRDTFKMIPCEHDYRKKEFEIAVHLSVLETIDNVIIISDSFNKVIDNYYHHEATKVFDGIKENIEFTPDQIWLLELTLVEDLVKYAREIVGDTGTVTSKNNTYGIGDIKVTTITYKVPNPEYREPQKMSF